MEDLIPNRKIIHVDMDAFYASVEQMDNPLLRGKPIAVGGSENRGVVAAASYEARKFGVRSAISGVMAKKNCPELIFVRPRFDRYKEISSKIQKIFYVAITTINHYGNGIAKTLLSLGTPKENLAECHQEPKKQ